MSLQNVLLGAICIFHFWFCSSWFVSYHIHAKFCWCLVAFILPPFYLSRLLYRWSCLRNVVTDCQNKERLPERNVKLWFLMRRVCKLVFFLPRNPTSCFIMFLTRTIGCCHISHRTWRICDRNFYNRDSFHPRIKYRGQRVQSLHFLISSFRTIIIFLSHASGLVHTQGNCPS